MNSMNISKRLGTVIFVTLFSFQSTKIFGQDNYQTIASGNWNGVSVWQKDVAGNGVFSSTSTPPTASNSISITILNSHTVTVTASTDADSLTVVNGGILVINGSQVLTIQNGPGVDMQVNGSLNNNGTLTLSASSVSRVAGTLNNFGAFSNASATTLFFDAGSIYDHKFTTTAGTIPTASWNSSSTCLISGYTTNSTAPTGLNQTFGNFTWNTVNLNLGGTVFDMGGQPTNVNGIYTVECTGAGDGLTFKGSGTATLNYGSLVISNTTGITYLALADVGTVTLNCTNFSMSGVNSSLDFGFSTGSSTFNVSGNYNVPSGSLNYTSSSASGGFFFNGTSLQLFSDNAVMNNAINYTINAGAIVDLGTSKIDGSGNFTLNGTINLGSTNPSGALQSSTTSGNIQISGTRTYNSGSTIVFNGSAGQFFGNGMPTNTNVTINNSNGVSLTQSTTIGGTLKLQNGNLNNGIYSLTIGLSNSNIGTIVKSPGSNIIIGTGSVTKWFNTNNITLGSDSGLFPIAIAPDSSRFVWIYGVPSTGGTLTVAYSNVYGGTNYGASFLDGGIIVNKRTNLSWTLASGNGLAGSSFGLRFRASGIPGVTVFTDLRAELSTGIAPGTSSNGTGSNAVPEVNRTALSAANLSSTFYIASGSTNALQLASISNNTISSTQNICAGSTPTGLTGSTPTGGDGLNYTFTWLSSTTSGTAGFAVASGTNNTQNYSPSSLTQSTWYRRYVTSSGFTDTSTAVAITVNTIPTITGTTPNSICGTGTVGLGATASAGTINWYAASSGGVSLGTGTTFTTPSISSSTTYYVDATSSGCTTASRTSVLATVNTIPTITGTTPNSICGTGTVGLGATASAGTINWYAASSGGVSLGTGTTFTTPSISSSTTYYVDATSSGCTTASRTSVLATVNLVIATNSATANQTICSGTTPSSLIGSTPTGGNGTYTYSWLSSTTSATAGFTVATGTTTGINYSPSSLISSTWYRRLTRSGGCSDTTSAVAITVNAAGTWTGASSTAWNNTANWSCPLVPTSSTSVTISSSTNAPIITDAQQVNNLTIQSGGSLTLNASASQLSIYGTVTNNGTFTNSNGKLIFSGSGPQTIPAGTYSKIQINSTFFGVGLGGAVTLNDSLILTLGNLYLTNNNLTLGNSSYASAGNSSSYICNNGTGHLTINNIGSTGKTGNVIFPIGNSTFNPAILINTGTTDNFTANVIDSITNTFTGTVPTGAKLTSSVVNRSWIITEGTIGGSNATITLQWALSDETASFNRTSCYEAIYSSSWSGTTATSATGTNPYTQSRSGISSFTAFGVGTNPALPVSLINFSGTKKLNNVDLNWTTASEINNDYFDVQRSFDAINFESIGEVKGHGTTSLLNNYNFLDQTTNHKPQTTNILYYRLKQVDFDGKFRYSEIVNVKLENDKIDITIYPNPAQNIFSISINNLTENCEGIFDLTDVSGKLIKQTNFIADKKDFVLQYECNNLPDGIYFIHIYSKYFSFYSKLFKE